MDDAAEVIGIAGTGIMATGIAERCLRTGHAVVLVGRRPASARRVEAAITRKLTQDARRGRLAGPDRNSMLARLATSTDLGDLAPATIVMECIVEDSTEKRSLLEQIDAISTAAVLASNTSTLSISHLADATRRPDRVCGIHFFNPAATMPVVELARGRLTGDEAFDRARSFVASCGQRPIVVPDRPGFVVNRLLFAYLNAALRLRDEEGIASHDIDAAIRGGCGFPMGPFEVLDLVGLPTALAILETLDHELGGDTYAPAAGLRELVAAAAATRLRDAAAS